ncbi:MAG: S26 family signal peptidase [Nanopusillaceae archaeon]
MLRVFDFLLKKEGIKRLLKVEDNRVLGKRILLFVLLVISSIMLFTFLFSKIVVSLGDSTSHHIFLKVNKEPGFGDYVVIKTPESDPFAKGKLITKRVACASGMYVKIVGLDYYCCDSIKGKDSWDGCSHLGQAKTESKKGESVTPYNPCRGEGNNSCFFEVPLGYYFLVNPHPDSYDSRYLGLIHRGSIISVLKPIL